MIKLNFKNYTVQSLVFILVFFGLLIFSTEKVLATCTHYGTVGPWPELTPADNSCVTNADGSSSGFAVYSCGIYTVQGNTFYGCYGHAYDCTGPCGGSGGGSSGGAGECPWQAIDCGTGLVKDTTTIVGQQVGSLTPPCGVGTAQSAPQTDANCAGWQTIPGEPCTWTSCPTRNNPNKMCCTGGTPDETFCVRWNIWQYACTCGATSPTNLAFNRTLNTISWTPGSGGTGQKLYVGANSTEVANNCPGLSSPSCVINQTNLSSSTASYSTAGLLTAGTVYYAKVTNSNGTACNTDSATLTLASTCTLSPTTVTLDIGQTQLLTSAMATSGLTVNFVSGNPAVASVSPASDGTVSYQTTVTANSGVGSPTSVTSSVYSGATLICSSATTVSVNAVTDPWWQTKDGDVTTNGNLTSKVPTGNYFSTVGSGGFPGIPVFGGTFNLSSDTTKVSVNSWNSNTASTEGRLFDYSYFSNLVPQDIVFNDVALLDTPVTSQYGYEWYKTTTSLTIGSDIDFGTRKVILLVENGDLNINAKINLTDNSGFFGAFVNGNIIVDSALTSVSGPAIEGLYMSDLAFNTGVGPSQLYIRGSVAAHGGILLNRDLADDNTPAEVFEFAPDQILLFPEKLGYRKQRWVEVAP